VQEKVRIVEEASEPGASVSAVALRNGVNDVPPLSVAS
jgi:transposase-like protein